ncbi:MAG TPA: spore germination protein [Mollicutes bacterium]|nr:spore germination protein [Mollicutes bacterium]
MEKIDINAKKVIDKIKKQTYNSPDIIVKELKLNDTEIAIVFCESMANSITINDFILEFLQETKMNEVKISNIYQFLESNMPTHKVIKVNNYKDLYYTLLSGFTLIIINGSSDVISIETKAALDSGIADAKNEKVMKGPKDSFTENYQTNIGLIRKRIKSESLRLEEHVIGSKSNTKVGIVYMDGIASKKLVDQISKKIKNIDIDAVFDSNYVIETISGNKKKTFPIYLSTERPDFVSINLLDGRIAIIVENTPYVIIVPAVFNDFFLSSEDFYQKNLNVNFTRIVRLIALLITILLPAIYISVSTYNHEAIPTNLLINFATQRQGVPLPTVVEILMMMVVFEILKETDTRAPSAIGSSLSIVGTLVLGQAAVAAGIVSPITIIVVATTSISGLISYSIDVVNGIRWWRIIFIVLSSFAGLYGVLVAGLIFVINISSIKSFGIPYLTPFAPFFLKEQNNGVFLSNKRKFNVRSRLTAKKDIERQAK